MDNEIDNKICEIVTSQKGHNKINVRSYLMVKEKDQNDIYYWCCEKRKSENCKATNGNVVNAVAHIKKQAKETRKSLVQIIQSNITIISEEVATYMSTQNALCASVRKAKMLPEPQSLDGIDIQDSLQYILSG
ncbi:4874_t:CDS:2 [Funneliformis geosporum]|nr:4874_t:CDS:2 [Funneliformis geosporum]